MTDIQDRKVQAQYLSNWALVRLPDGRVGVFTKRNNVGRITFLGQTGVDVGLSEELELLKHPAELAAEALERHYAEQSDESSQKISPPPLAVIKARCEPPGPS